MKGSDIEQGQLSLAKQTAAQQQTLTRWPQSNRAMFAYICILVFCFWFFLPGLTCLAQAGFGIVYWAIKSPAQWAAPLARDQLQSELVVPKILHHTWKNREIPEKWAAAQKSCKDLHPEYEFKLWTDADAVHFIEEHYPWFLPTFLAYPYQIQRVDSIRYFILYHYGGIYMDLDMGCRKRIDFMRQYNFTAPLTYPGGVSNDVIAAVPGDAYLHQVISNLRYWNKWMVIKYIQVMFSAGPMFLTTQYSLYRNKAGIAVIPPALYGKYDLSGDPYFYHLHGSSWHEGDAAFVFWLDKYKMLLISAGIILAATIFCGYWVRILLSRQKTRTG